MDRLTILNENISRFQECYKGQPEGLYRTPNVTQIAAYENWINERDSLVNEIAKREKKATSAQIARALIDVNINEEIPLKRLFWMQSADVNTEGLLQLAEWRVPETITMFLENGADVNARDSEGFSVLEMVLQGHDGYWRKNSPHWNKEIFEIFAKYKVNRTVRQWIIDECCIGAPKYVLDFLM